MHRPRLLVALVFAALLLAAPAAPASSSGVVVSQVYAGGGNSGASFTNDFVELFNAGSVVDQSGRLDRPVRHRSRHELAGDCPRRLDRARPPLPGSAELRGVGGRPAAHSRRHRYVQPGRLRRQGRGRHQRDGAQLRCHSRQLLRRLRDRGLRRIRLRSRLRRRVGRSCAEQLDRSDSRRCRLHGHRLERRRLRCGHADTAQQLVAGNQLHRRWWVTRRDDRLGERRRRHPEQPVARARAARDQLRHGLFRHDSRRRSPSGSRSTATTQPAIR